MFLYGKIFVVKEFAECPICLAVSVSVIEPHFLTRNEKTFGCFDYLFICFFIYLFVCLYFASLFLTQMTLRMEVSHRSPGRLSFLSLPGAKLMKSSPRLQITDFLSQ